MTESEDLAALWSLDPTVAFLNHGSFGACPKAVLKYQSELRRMLEREPVQFMLRRLPELLARERAFVAEFVGAEPDDLVFVANATAGVNAVLRSLRFEPGDQVLTTDHAYAACRNVLDYAARQNGCEVVVARVPFPLSSPDEVTRAVVACVTPRTRLALLDHVTSVTGLVLPIQQLVGELEARGVRTLIDGAHAPGMLELRLSELGASYYAANFHKWGCSPKGAGMLWVRRELQDDVVPPVISHGYTAREARFRAQFDWQGTVDPTPVLSIGHALRFLGDLVSGGWPELRRRNRELVLWARGLLCRRLGIGSPAPDSMIGSLGSVPLPASKRTAREVYEALVARRFEVLVQPWPTPADRILRISAHLYNSPDEYERLADVLPEVL